MRQSFAASITRTLLIYRSQVEIVLQWKILPPNRRIFRRLRQFNYAEEWIFGFLLMIEDVDEQGYQGDGRHRRQNRNCDRELAIATKDCHWISPDELAETLKLSPTKTTPSQTMPPNGPRQHGT